MSLICPTQNEPVTLTCIDRQVATLIWRVKPHNDRFSYTANEEEGKVKIVDGNFTAILVDVSNSSGINTGETVADLTSTLTAPIMAITNGTIITCETLYSLQEPATKTTSSITLILAGTVGLVLCSLHSNKQLTFLSLQRSQSQLLLHLKQDLIYFKKIRCNFLQHFSMELLLTTTTSPSVDQMNSFWIYPELLLTSQGYITSHPSMLLLIIVQDKVLLLLSTFLMVCDIIHYTSIGSGSCMRCTLHMRIGITCAVSKLLAK